MTTLNNNCEFETKYRVAAEDLFPFKSILEEKGYDTFLYAEGPDYYYTLSDGSFARYRKGVNEKRAEITFKDKPQGATSNIKRHEVDWRVDNTSYEDIKEGLEMRGYSFNFEIYKMCHIYKKDDINVVFYTVRSDRHKDEHHYVELEIDKAKISKYTENQALEAIREAENVFLVPLGYSYKNRLSKSLFEIYRR